MKTRQPRYDEKTLNKKFKCRMCRKMFKPKNSNAFFKTLFCSAKCSDDYDIKIGQR